jgi:hypothetical protein
MKDYRLHEHFTNKPPLREASEVWSDAARAAALAARRAKAGTSKPKAVGPGGVKIHDVPGELKRLGKKGISPAQAFFSGRIQPATWAKPTAGKPPAKTT